MEEHQLDALTKRLAHPVPRRTVLRAALATCLGGVAALASLGKGTARAATCIQGGATCTPSGPNPQCCSGYCTTAGTCACPHGTTLCGGTCVKSCPPPQTVGGNCACVCPSGQTACGQTCVNTATDSANCGGCGNACPAGQVCAGGTCQCPVAACGTGGSAVCCAAGSACCGTTCCPAGRQCCGSACCLAGQACANGACGTVCCATGGTCSVCGAGQCCSTGGCVTTCPAGFTCVNGGCFKGCSGSRCGTCSANCVCFTTRAGTGPYCYDIGTFVGACSTDADCPQGTLCSPYSSGGTPPHLCTRPCPCPA